ncbi:MAG: YhjD/YihY/BrkB family envelope integrity protein [Actinomycetota bacterium]
MRKVWDIALATHRRFGADSAGFMAAALTYRAFLSLFPLLLLGASVLGFVLAGDPDLYARAVRSVSDSLPGIGTLVAENLDSVTANRSVAGIVGLAGLLWTGVGVAEATSFTLAKVWRIEPRTSTVRVKIRAIAAVLTLGLIGLAGIAVTIAVSAVDASGFGATALRIAGVVIALGLDFALFIATYRLLGPAHRSILAPWRGAALAAAGWTGLKLIGGWYAARTVANSSAVYGTFASTIGVLVILSLAARIFLYGAELNAIWVERIGGDPTMNKGKDGVEPNGRRSTPQLVRSIANDTATLVKKEVELARQEFVEAIIARLKAAAAMLAAGVAGLVAVIFLGSAAAYALESVVSPSQARLIVGGGFLVIAALAAAIGLPRAKRPPLKPEMTVETVKEDIEWAKAQLKR